jgi:hypothetical protein
MADNVQVTQGSGTAMATDDIGGVHYPRFKLTVGGDGSANDVSEQYPLPVSMAGGDGLATEATLASMASKVATEQTLSSLSAKVATESTLSKIATEATLSSLSSTLATEATLSKVATEATLASITSTLATEATLAGIASTVATEATLAGIASTLATEATLAGIASTVATEATLAGITSGLATEATLSSIEAKIPAPLASQPSVARQLAAGSTTANTALTASVRRVSIRAVGADIRYAVGSGSQTASATSHFIAQNERLEIAVPASPNIAVIRNASTDGTLELSELI